MIIRDLHLPVSCKHDGCEFSKEVTEVVSHELQCQYRKVRCLVPWCYKEIQFLNVEEHMAIDHDEMIGVGWYPWSMAFLNILDCRTAPICKTISGRLDMQTWRQDSILFFATIALDKFYCHNIWVTAACSKEEAGHYRAEIRLGSIDVDCSINFSGPVLSLESNILEEDIYHASELSACLQVNSKTFDRYEDSSQNDPVTCIVYRKVFHSPSAGDLEEKKNNN
jgi:hypothetical protein